MTVWRLQFLADILGTTVDRPHNVESTAIGAAWLAGQKVGLYGSMQTFSQEWHLGRQFEQQMDSNEADRLYSKWQQAVASTINMAQDF